ncbi:MAG TPA: DUF4091 domain-containing protein [Armatimonadetes bacterium]|nr:DUF4091 domain-containing protein [Armatimonadota bacterium]
MAILRALLVATASLMAVTASAAPVPNASFEEGKDRPAAWSPSDSTATWAEGGRTGRRCLAINGDGNGSHFWKCDTWLPEPGAIYRLSFWARSVDASGGCVVSGLNILNEDFPLPGKEWVRYTRVFAAPRAVDGAYLRLGCWATTGKVLFDDVTITPVLSLVEQLGEGERVSQGRYGFQAPLQGEGSNYSRALVGFTAGFNTNRWVLSDGATITYRHAVPGVKQRAATLQANIGYYEAGRLLVDASRDGKTWHQVGTVGEKGTLRCTLPSDLFPADEIQIRLRGEGEKRSGEDSHPGSFQIHGYAYEAELEGTPRDAIGRTSYLEIEQERKPSVVTVESLGGLRPGLDPYVRLRVSNPGRTALPVTAVFAFSPEGGKARQYTAKARIPAGGEAPVVLPYTLRETGRMQATLRITAGKEVLLAGKTEFDISALFAADSGYLVSQDATAAVWWAEPTHKVSRERPVPALRQPVVRLSAAGHEYEPFQVVLRPSQALQGVTASVGDLVGPKGARIAASNIRIHRVHYVRVERPTDRVGTPGEWPDALPPLDGPFDVAAGTNQPLWVTVYVPAGTPAGDYRGALRLSAGSWRQEVPVQLRVWDFTLPKETHLRTAFGLNLGTIRRYHNLETQEELAQVFDLYLRNFAAHRISPYDPMALAPIRVSFGENAWDGGQQVGEQPFEGKRCLKVVDNSDRSSIAASYRERVPVDPEAEHVLSWAARTEKEGQTYLVTVQNYDAAGAWMSGRNIDLRFQGSTTWKRESVSLKGRLPKDSRAISIFLRPVTWSEKGEATGTAWFDALSLRVAGGPELLKDGGFEEVADPLRVKVDFTEFDRAAHRAFNELGFNSFRLHLQGMGGGTFHSRHKGRIGAYEQGTPEYEALFTSYARQLQDHLEEKGWLDKAYIYWFDEPEPRDYEFVKEGMALLKRAAPKLARMLTEQVEPELVGSVDIWCPVTSSYDPERARGRQAQGEKIWWYVCTGPKAPYCTLFIDHPGIEMRMWLWQTVKYNVEGILVWTSNYWTSNAAYPPPAIQNPWEDAMGYISGYDYQPGQIGYWGNGDGRFIYPPNRDPANDKRKHLTGPVDSCRWEMLREGIEDYEYFYLLREAIAQARARGASARTLAAAEKLLQVPPEVCVDMTTFTLDPAPLYAHREKIARAIESLRKAK